MVDLDFVYQLSKTLPSYLCQVIHSCLEMPNDSAPNVLHFSLALYFAIAFLAARFLLDRFLFRRLALRLLSRGTSRLGLDESTRLKIAKCSESMWKFTSCAAVEYCLLETTYNEPWFWDITQYFSGWPNQELKLPLKLIYMCQCGFYIFGIVALLAWETRRKDFTVMMSHHVVTVILISVSYMTRFFRAGAVVLALHDASDLFLESGKVFKYSGNELGASVCFVFFAVSWLVLRLIFFPFWVIRATSFNLMEVLDLSDRYGMSIYYIFNTMLMTLLIFHIYWGKLIFAMIIRQLKNKGQVGEDVREVSDDE